MTDGPSTDRVRELLREREDRPGADGDDVADAGPDRDEDRAREMRERVEPPAGDR